MKELRFVRPDYETCGEQPPARFSEAHRVVRMAFGVAAILDVPTPVYVRALDAFDRVAGDGEDGERRYTSEEVVALSALFAELHDQLEAALDDNHVPRGTGGAAIVEEAHRALTLENGEVDDDRVFELMPDGHVATLYPRMSLGTFREQLSTLGTFLKRAAERGLEVAILE